MQAVETGPTYAIMSWDAVPGAAGYLVSWFNASGAQINADTTLDTEFEVEGLEPGETYNFRVAPVCSSGGTGLIYSSFIVVPIIVELLISTDNPLGNLVQTCSQLVKPVAECTVDFNVASTYIGKIKVIELNRVYYFRLRYFSNFGEGENPKVLLDLVKPEFYPELPVNKPALFTEYGANSGQIYDHGIANTNFYISLFEVRITKNSNKLYKIKISNTNKQNYSLDFSLFNTTIPSLINNENQNKSVFNSKSEEIEDQYLTPIHIKVFNSLGELVRVGTIESGLENLQFFMKNLPSGVYIISQYTSNTISSKKIIIDTK